MTKPDKPIESDVAFGEAAQNLRAAERFFDAGATEKAYAAAYIANAWTGLGSALQDKELGAVPEPYRLGPLSVAEMPPSPIVDSRHEITIHEDTESVRSPGWYQGECSCGWETTGHESVVEAASEKHKFEALPDHQHTEEMCGHPYDPFRNDCPKCNMPIEQFAQNLVCSARCKWASE